MSSHGTKASVGLLNWNGSPIRVMQGANWVLEDREDSTNQLRVKVSLASAEGVKSEQEVIFKGRKFAITGIDRDRADDLALLIADEVQTELADLILPTFKSVAWTLEDAMENALQNTRWTIGSLNGARFPVVDFEDISVLEALQFLARHQDARLVFDSLRRRVSILEQPGQVLEKVFTYGRQLTNIEKEERGPKTTVIYPTGADGLTISSVNSGVPYVEDYGYYTSQGISLSNARARYKKEDRWEETGYEDAENLKRDALNRLNEEAHPQITYTLTAAATVAVDGEDDFDLGSLSLGDQVHVWDQQIDAKLKAEVTAVTTSSDSSENRLVLSYLPESLNAGTEGRYFGDSGNPHGDRGRSGFQPRPSMPILESVNRVGGGLVRWNGQDHDGNTHTIPARFGTIETRVAKLIDGAIPSPDSDDAFSGTSISERGGGIASVTFSSGGEFAVWFYMVGRDGRTRSEYSEPLVVDVPALVDTEAIEEKLTEAEGRLDGISDAMDGYDTNIGNLNKELADLGEFFENGEVDADSWSVGGRIMGRQIIGETFAGATAAFLRLTSENLQSGAIQTRHLAITNNENLVPEDWHGDDAMGVYAFNPNGGFADGSSDRFLAQSAPVPPVWSPILHSHGRRGWTIGATEGSHSIAFRTGPGRGIAVTPGQKYAIQSWVRDFGNGGTLAWHINFYSKDGTQASNSSEAVVLDLRGYQHSADDDEGVTHEFTVPNLGFPGGMYMVPFLRHQAASSGSSRTVMEPKIRNMIGGELLVDGAVTTRHLFVTEEMTARLGEFLEIRSGLLKSNNIEAMNFLGGLITGSTIRSSLFETTATANRGIKFDSNNLRAWDSSGNLRFQLSASNGDLTATGTFRTHFSGNRIEMYDDGDGGNIRFTSGSALGSIKARASVGRLSMVWNALTGNDDDLPLVGVEQDKAILRYRSQLISVQGTTSSNQRMRFETAGRTAEFFGDLLMCQGSRTGYTNTSSGNQGPLIGTVGQRPEAGSTHVMEIRGEGNPVRISGASEFRVQRVYDSTTTLDANVRVGSTGEIRRATSATKYKVDPRELEVPDTILDVELHEWVDRRELERWAELEDMPRPYNRDDQWDYDGIDLSRTTGVLAEHVEAKGGKHFVEYGMDGELEEVNYTRLNLAQIQVEKRQRRADVSDLQNKYDALLERVSKLEGAS